MSDLMNFKKVLDSFQLRYEDLKREHDETLADLPEIYNENYISVQKAEEKKKFDAALEKLKTDTIKSMETVRNQLVRQETQRDTSNIDYALLDRLNMIAQADLPLTSEEYLNLITDCFSSGSSICERKLSAMIREKNSESISFPSASNSISLIGDVAKRICEAIEKHGTLSEYGKKFANDRILSGRWLESENEKYLKITTSDLVKLTGKELREKLAKKIDVSKIDKKESAGARFAREYSQKMNPKRNSAFIPWDSEE